MVSNMFPNPNIRAMPVRVGIQLHDYRIFAILVDSAAVWNSNGIDHLVHCSKEIQWFGARLKVVEALFRKDSSSVSFSTED